MKTQKLVEKIKDTFARYPQMVPADSEIRALPDGTVRIGHGLANYRGPTYSPTFLGILVALHPDGTITKGVRRPGQNPGLEMVPGTIEDATRALVNVPSLRDTWAEIAHEFL